MGVLTLIISVYVGICFLFVLQFVSYSYCNYHHICVAIGSPTFYIVIFLFSFLFSASSYMPTDHEDQHGGNNKADEEKAGEDENVEETVQEGENPANTDAPDINRPSSPPASSVNADAKEKGLSSNCSMISLLLYLL
jgi:hypothetical protein